MTILPSTECGTGEVGKIETVKFKICPLVFWGMKDRSPRLIAFKVISSFSPRAQDINSSSEISNAPERELLECSVQGNESQGKRKCSFRVNANRKLNDTVISLHVSIIHPYQFGWDALFSHCIFPAKETLSFNRESYVFLQFVRQIKVTATLFCREPAILSQTTRLIICGDTIFLWHVIGIQKVSLRSGNKFCAFY